ncbi:MAG: GAF domain-containing protein [Dehalococcoidales bacterium]|nr:GAF domain-containing protein [Dehalococcoidales bacterium]
MLNPSSDPLYILSPLVTIIVNFLLLVIVLVFGRRSSGRWLFSGVISSIGLWGIFIFGMRSSPDTEYAAIWNKLASIPAIGTFVLYYHFTAVYTQVKNQKWYIVASYILFLAVAALSPTRFIIEGVRVEEYGYAPVHGGFSVVLSIITFPLLAASIYNLVNKYRSSTSYEERNRLLYLLMAILFPVTGAILDSTTNLPPMLIWSHLVFIFICSLAIIKYQLMDVRIVFRKGLSYLVVSTFVGVPYGILLFTFNRFIDIREEYIWYPPIVILLLSIFLHPLQQWVQKYVDKLFYRERYDHLISLEHLSKETQSILDIDQLCTRFMNALSGAVRISRGCLFLLSDDNTSFEFKRCVESPIYYLDIRLTRESSFINWIETRHQTATKSELDDIIQLQDLSQEEKKIIERLDIHLLVPIFLHGDQLTGFLVLGEKKGTGEYSVEDIQFITTVSNQIAISLENARLYQSERNMRESLERIDAQKTEFLHSVANELKTPLTAILSSSEILEEGRLQDEDIKSRLFGNIRRSAQIMNASVTELIELAKTQIGEMKLNSGTTELSSFFKESAFQLMILFENKNQKLTFDMDGSLPTVRIDRDKLQQVIFNLLSNSNRYSPEGSEIILKAKEVNGTILVRVIDSAATIPEEEKEQIFNPYFRVNNVSERGDSPGVGLSLAISRKIIELHNGKLWVADNPAGGNIFSFTIPLE